MLIEKLNCPRTHFSRQPQSRTSVLIALVSIYQCARDY